MTLIFIFERRYGNTIMTHYKWDYIRVESSVVPRVKEKVTLSNNLFTEDQLTGMRRGGGISVTFTVSEVEYIYDGKPKEAIYITLK